MDGKIRLWEGKKDVEGRKEKIMGAEDNKIIGRTEKLMGG